MPSHAPHRIITLGETMILVTPTTNTTLESADQFRLEIGGAESNVAIHLAALGHHASWVSRVGDDALGRRLIDAVGARGVDTSLVETVPNAPTGVYFKNPGNGVLYYRRGSAASTMGPGILDRVPLPDAELVHISGITPALSASCSALIDAVIDRVEDTETVLSFDINYRPALWGATEAAARLHRLAQRADIVFVGLDEAETLWGTRTAAEVRAVLHAPQILVVKDGDVGATEFSAAGESFSPAPHVEVVEVVGAGDAFAAGYLAAQLDGKDAAERLSAGHARAALVLQSMSDFVADTDHDERTHP